MIISEYVNQDVDFLNLFFGSIFSQVPSSGPKGLLKGDVMKYILSNNLKPIQVKKPEPVAAPVTQKPAKSEKVEKPAAPQYQVG